MQFGFGPATRRTCLSEFLMSLGKEKILYVGHLTIGLEAENCL